MIETAVDWTLDLAALLASVVVGKRLAGLTWRQTAILVACFAVYGMHEAWEAGLIFGKTHVQTESIIHEVIYG